MKMGRYMLFGESRFPSKIVEKAILITKIYRLNFFGSEK